MKRENARACAGLGLWLVILLLGGPVRAGDTYWQHDPAAAGDWLVPANWTAGLPTEEDSAYVDNGGTARIAAGLAEAYRVYLGHAAGAAGTIELSGGELRPTGYQYIGYYGTGRFIQTAGTNTVESRLHLAFREGSSGTYELSGGELLVLRPAPYRGADQHVGYRGTGLFIQTGGTNTVEGTLSAGDQKGSSGTYALSGGDLRVESWEWVGKSGTGHFVQTGGTNTAVTGLYLGHYEGSSGTYELAGTGQISAMHQVVGHEGTGLFIQTGGINQVEEQLVLALEDGASGTYELGGGELQAREQYVGSGGTGVFIQTGGINDVTGGLYLGHAIAGPSGQGTYELSGGELRVMESQYIGYDGTGLFAQTGGTNKVSGGLILGMLEGSSGTYTISGGSLSTGRLFVGLAGSGALSITGASADITVSQSLLFGPNSAFSAVAGSTIHMTGSEFHNSSTDPAALGGLANLRLIFEGGAAGFDPVEVAGEDLGPVPAGWTDNFALGTLQLGEADAGRIQLVDDADNQQDGPGNEALYVDWLILNAGAAIDFNALALYFRNGGLPKQLFAGDANLDGRVDGLDHVTWSNNYGQGGKAWKDADYNGDTVVDGLDYIAWSNNYLLGAPGGAGTPVPEPGAMALILAGACLILRRRRV